MQVYGDRARTLDPREQMAAVEDLCARTERSLGLARHAAAVSALIEAGGLVQGLADDALERQGEDGPDPAADLAMQVALELAQAVDRSWRGTAGPPVRSRALARLGTLALPDRITVKACEGYAFYGVYPELYAEAARRTFTRPPKVIGLRSIGASLAAAAAAGAGAGAPVTLRPVGDPFARQVRASPGYALAPEPQDYAVVDEGPGLSGSSFASVGDLLQDAGAPAERIVYMPSHGGEPGPEAPPPRRTRWKASRRAWTRFEDMIEPQLAAWASPLAGAPLEPLQPLAWRGADGPPAWPQMERRKYRLLAEGGDFLLKFAGLGRYGEAALDRARSLHAAGFTAEPLGLAHGFLVQRWIEAKPLARRPQPRDAFLAHLSRYLDHRARMPGAEGATPDELLVMIRRNLGLVGLDRLAERAAARLPAPAELNPVAVDGRMHAWEWLQDDAGRFWKTDAVDHCAGHDLVGAQDIAWDVAGAAVEFDLAEDETARLRPVSAPLLAFMTIAYLAFQLGWWRLAAQGGGGAAAETQAGAYEHRLRRLA